MATVDVAATGEVANAKDQFISCSRQPVEWLSSSWLDVLGVPFSLVCVCPSLPVIRLIIWACEFQYVQDPTAPVDRPCVGSFPTDARSEGDIRDRENPIFLAKPIAHTLPCIHAIYGNWNSLRPSTVSSRCRCHSSARRAVSLHRSVASAWCTLIRSPFRAGHTH